MPLEPSTVISPAARVVAWVRLSAPCRCPSRASRCSGQRATSGVRRLRSGACRSAFPGPTTTPATVPCSGDGADVNRSIDHPLEANASLIVFERLAGCRINGHGDAPSASGGTSRQECDRLSWPSVVGQGPEPRVRDADQIRRAGYRPFYVVGCVESNDRVVQGVRAVVNTPARPPVALL